MKVIIAEKRSLGETIASAVGATSKQSGYIEGNGYLVTWCSGHLYELARLEKYMPAGIKRSKSGKIPWKEEVKHLPYFPDNWDFRYYQKDGVAEQVQTIRHLINRPDVDVIYSAGDADREGEVIVRLAIEKNLKRKKKILRIWAQSLTKSAILDAVKNAKDDSEYDSIDEAGRARAGVDWLMGVELTVYATVKSNAPMGNVIRVGRCITPIVQKIVEREREIEAFKPEKYFCVEGRAEKDGLSATLLCKKEFSKDEEKEAAEYADMLNGKDTIVTDVDKKEVVVKPGRLFSLSSLQSFITKTHKSLTPSMILNTVQSLYEAGYVTYPRTNSQYLTDEEAEKADAVISALKWAGFTDLVNKPGNKDIYDNTKVESHSALIPTENIPKNLTGIKKTVYEAIRDRFLAVFCSKPCVVERTKLTIVCGPEVFKIKGDAVIQEGWRSYEKSAKKDDALPRFERGEILHPGYKPVEKETLPPRRFTVSSLNAWMLSPLKGQEDSEDRGDYTDEEWKEILSDATICTEATRSSIIDNAISSEYIRLENGSYYATEKGCYVSDIVDKLQIDLSPRKTVELSKSMHDIAAGSKGAVQLYEETKVMLEEIFSKDIKVAGLYDNESGSRKPLGKCPVCGKNVFEYKNAYSCEDREGCGFAIWKNDRYFKAIGYKPTASGVSSILKNGKVKASGLKSKKGNRYSAYVILDSVNGKYPNWRLEF